MADAPASAGLWRLPVGAVVEIPLREFAVDFRVMVKQLEDALDMGMENGVQPLLRCEALIVRVRPFDDFRAWAEGEEPDWDRYLSTAAIWLHGRGLIDERIMHAYDAPASAPVLEAASRAAGFADQWRCGFDAYVAALARALADEDPGIPGEPLPPLLSLDGQPRDGRHRTLAAIRAGITAAPVAEILEGK